MNESINLWEALAGVAIFMLGMRFLEDSLQSMAGRSFKIFLKKNTSNRLRAVAGGTVVTAVLQSSSVVNLLVLAFVGASLLTLQNALAVILGANLGTTISNWVIATVGFSYQISDFAYPLTAVAGVAMALSKTGSWLHQWSSLLLGFSFIFLGLAFIRSGVETVISQYDFSGFSSMSHLTHLLAGFIITSLVQSSSATMAIVLSLLFAKGITLPAAMAITLGSEIGTTVKVVIASLGKNAVKKQVAVGNLLFNIITVSLVFIFLSSVHQLLTDVMGIKNNLIALVAFQSLVNLLCIIIFLPLLPFMSRYLEKAFVYDSEHEIFINKAGTANPLIAIDALQNEAARFFNLALHYIVNSFRADRSQNVLPGGEKEFNERDLPGQYEYLKTLHGKIHAFNSNLLQQHLNPRESRQLEKLIAGVRNTMYAAKSIQDAQQDIMQLKNSSKDEKYNYYQKSREKVFEFCKKVNELMSKPQPFGELLEVYRNLVKDYDASLQGLYGHSVSSRLDEMEISTLMNFNREMVSAFKSLVFALKDLVLEEKEAEEFEAMPGFIR